MAKISEYAEATDVLGTDEIPLYRPTGTLPADKDRYIRVDTLSKAYSVLNHTVRDAAITIGAEVTNVRAVTIQLKDAAGNALTVPSVVRLIVFTTAAMVALSAGGSTGLAIGANGLIIFTEVAKLSFIVKSDAAGLITMTYTDTGTDAAFLAVQIPDGRLIVSTTMTNT